MKEKLEKGVIRTLLSRNFCWLKQAKEDLRDLLKKQEEVRRGEDTWTYYWRHLPADCEEVDRVKNELINSIKRYEENIADLKEQLKTLEEQNERRAR